MDDTKFLKKNIKSCTLDVHPTERALVVSYELEATILGQMGDAMLGDTKMCQKIIRLKDLTSETDASALASQVIAQCKLIAPSKHALVEQLIYYLQKRKANGSMGSTADTMVTSTACSSTLGGERATVNQLDEYIEMLYEDVAEKVRGTALVLQLARNPDHLEGMLHNETLLGALARTLREDWKKNFELATNITYTFFCFSTFSPFHQMIGHFKIGALCLQMVDAEVQRYDAWLVDIKTASAKDKTKFDALVHKQEQLVRVCLHLLLNLSEDCKVETKMVSRGIVLTLVTLMERRHNLELCMLVLIFLAKLAVFRQNVEAMLKHEIVTRLTKLIPLANKSEELLLALLQFMLNMSFHPKFVESFVSSDCMTPVAVCVMNDGLASAARRLLYHLSHDDRGKAKMTQTPVIPHCLSLILDADVSPDAEDRTEALMLAINLALNSSNALMMAGDDGGGLRLLFARAFDTRDILTLKLLANVTRSDSDIVQNALVAYVGDLCKVITAHLTEEPSGQPSHSSTFVFALECLTILANVKHSQFDWAHLVESTGLNQLIMKTLTGDAADDVVLAVVSLLGTMAACDASAAAMIHARQYVAAIMALLSGKQEDDEIVLQIIYVFYHMMFYEDTRHSLLNETDVPAYLIDLMHDKNAHIRGMCDSTLELIAESGDEWARRIADERFRWHNAQWLEMVGLNDMNGGVIPIHGDEDVRYALDDSSSEDGYDIQADELLGDQSDDDDDPTLVD